MYVCLKDAEVSIKQEVYVDGLLIQVRTFRFVERIRHMSREVYCFKAEVRRFWGCSVLTVGINDRVPSVEKVPRLFSRQGGPYTRRT